MNAKVIDRTKPWENRAVGLDADVRGHQGILNRPGSRLGPDHHAIQVEL